MIKKKQYFVNVLRHLRLLQFIDYFRYLLDCRNNRLNNKVFSEAHPGFRLPPPDLAYDAYGHTNWNAYYHSGKEHAQYISNLIRNNCSNQPLKICEWGCGPARILRHIPQFFADRSILLYGFDYNQRTIQWCQTNIKNIVFKHNRLTPPLDQEDDSFDCLYGVSVFTHLSKELHFTWIKELSRVLKPDGLLIFTTHGELVRANLLNKELRMFENGELFVRDKVEEGKRTFVAYHPPSFIIELLKGLTVIAHIKNPIPQKLTQDIWIVKNTKH